MKNIFRKIGTGLFLVIVSGSVVIARGWRAIVPLKTSRVDVERLLGVPIKSSQRFSYYRLPGEIVVIQFQIAACDSLEGKFGLGWAVPPGTVVGIGVIPKGTHRKEEYVVASNFKVEDNGAGFVYYSNEAAGLSIETYNSLVTLVDYYPGTGEEQLQCPRIQECCFDLFPTFDEYQVLAFEDERARLDSFLIQMNQRSARGVIEVIAPSKKVRDERLKLAARAKAYLVKQRGLESERLLLVDGGYGEDAVTRLSLYSIGGLPSRIHIFADKDPVKAAPNKRLQRTRLKASSSCIMIRSCNGSLAAEARR